MRPLPPILIGLLLLGCRARPEETGRTPSTDTVEVADTARPAAQPVGAAHGAVEFEAPPLIPAMHAQLDQLTSPAKRGDPNSVTSYKGAAGRLIDAMKADLTRVGLADSGAFRLLSDSVLNELGGGTGMVRHPDPQDLSANTERMRRLIALYESWMRQVPK
ncbi:MAG TPA: hypothetical protein VH763_12615 [Gemmatimonadales bacterium]|jgi:hypothetical protein